MRGSAANSAAVHSGTAATAERTSDPLFSCFSPSPLPPRPRRAPATGWTGEIRRKIFPIDLLHRKQSATEFNFDWILIMTIRRRRGGGGPFSHPAGTQVDEATVYATRAGKDHGSSDGESGST